MLVGALLYYTKRKNNQKESETIPKEQASFEDDLRDVHHQEMGAESKFSIQQIMDKLVRLNLQIRIEGESIQPIIGSFEKLFDKIRELAPTLHAEEPDGEITWQIDEMVVDFIPGLLKDYLKGNQGELEQQHVISTCEELFLQLSELTKEYESTANADLKRNASVIKETMRIRSKIPVESKTNA
ncbi:MAG: hypothetical protein MRY57_04285 [Candidatus Pacebacteria bacterium]|nr:hypothetical protein [Candidatus Paceibacterota bacterium]